MVEDIQGNQLAIIVVSWAVVPFGHHWLATGVLLADSALSNGSGQISFGKGEFMLLSL